MINDVSNTLQVASSQQRQAATTNSTDGKKLGKEDFLNLLMTQMAHQDPMDPMDTDSMMQQVAAMGTVEQLQNLNHKTEDLLGLQQQISRAGTSSLLGKDVQLTSNQLALLDGSAAPVAYTLAGDADQVDLHIINQNGDIVRNIQQEAMPQGSHHYIWDGLDNEGDLLSDGQYTLNVKARTEDGEDIKASLSKSGQVSDIRFDGNRSLVKVNGEWIGTHEIQGIGDQTEQRFAHALPRPLHTELQLRQAISLPKTKINE